MRIESFEDIELLLKPSIISLSAGESYSLTRIRRLMVELGNPQNKIKVIHVAGTSGKTSTAYYISEMLRRNGYKTGLSVSPHIDEMNERLQVDLIPLPEKQFCAELTKFLEILSRLSIKPTYFELFTAFAFWYFAENKVDYAVMETGLGGLLDATNVVDRTDKICAITDIGFDHMDILGNTLPEITKQKAGIIQPKNAVFIIQQPDEIIKIVRSTAAANKSELKIVSEMDKKIGLPKIQKRNWTLAKEVASYIFAQDNKPPLGKDGLSQASKIIIPGRLEKLTIGEKQVIIDGAHNHQKMQVLIDSLKQEFGDEKICVVLAISSNKKPHLLRMTRLVSMVAGEIILTSFDTQQDFIQKSLSPGYLAQYFLDREVRKAFNPEQALAMALKSNESKILVTGSLYLAGKIRKLIT